MSTMVSQITNVSIVCSPACSGADQREHQSSTSLAFVRGIHQQLVNSPHKEPVTRKIFPFDDVIMVPFSCHIFLEQQYHCRVLFKTISLQLGNWKISHEQIFFYKMLYSLKCPPDSFQWYSLWYLTELNFSLHWLIEWDNNWRPVLDEYVRVIVSTVLY